MRNGLAMVGLVVLLSGCSAGFKLSHSANDPAVSFGFEGIGAEASATDPNGETVFGVKGGVNPTALGAWLSNFLVGQWEKLTGGE